MIIWTRFGILYPVLWFAVMWGLSQLLRWVGFSDWAGVRTSLVIGLIVVSVINFFAAVVEADNESESSLFFIPMPFWSVIGLGLALATAVGLISA